MKRNIFKPFIVPVIATIGVIYLWLEFGSYGPIWWPFIMAIILIGHYAAYFINNKRYKNRKRL